MAKNPFTWVEIYVDDMNRSQKFYETILEIELQELPMTDGPDDILMMSFPSSEGENISGALVKTSSMKPGTGGTVVYLTCEDCTIEASRVDAAGGKLLQPKMSIGEFGFCSIFMDTEGNTVGLHSMQ